MIRSALAVFVTCGSALACTVDGVPLASEVDGAPDAFVALNDVPLAEPFSLRVIICGQVDAGGVQVDAIMPAHQHGMNYIPEITHIGDGVFDVDGMLFHMPGNWELRVSVETGGRSIPYTHTIILK